MIAAGSTTGEVAEVLRWFDAKPGLARAAGAARRLDALDGAFAARDVVVVRNFTLEPGEALLRVAGYRAGLRLRVRYSGYEPWSADTVALLDEVDPDAVVVALRLEELAPALTRDVLATETGAVAGLADGVVDHLAGIVEDVRARGRATVLVHNLVAPVAPAAGLADRVQVDAVRRINVALAARLAATPGVHVLDVDHRFARAGYEACFDARGARTADAPLSPLALQALADLQARSLAALQGARAKCLVLDADDTLWHGTVGEDGVGGLQMDVELQRQLLDLRRRGVLLAVASKNEERDVLAVLREHPDCLLAETDFAALRVDWDDKAANVAAIAEELGLGLEHLVFLDDNPAECARVAEQFPEVRVLRHPADLGGGSLDDLGLFDSLVTTDADRGRTDRYRAERGRRAARGQAGSVEDHLRGLEMVATVGAAGAADVPRLAQLTQRTNQFNLTTRRYDEAALHALIADPAADVLWLGVRDRFGDSGVVGLAIARRDGAVAEVDTLLLSCRVIGRGLERVLVHRLAARAAAAGATELTGDYLPTARNAQVADLYERLGFTGEGPWRWDMGAGPPPEPDWIAVVGP